MEEQSIVCIDRHLESLWYSVAELALDRASPRNVHEFHVHPECEININFSGDVSFAIEKTIYPVVPGSVIIARPYGYHHCIYHSDALHRHIWMLFSPTGNEWLLDPFFNRASGTGNLLLFSAEQLRRVEKLCRKMQQRPDSEFAKMNLFFQLLHHLLEAERPNRAEDRLPDGVKQVLNHMEAHYRDKITIRDMARLAHVSINTLERQFAECLNVTPSRYLQRKRLANSAALLSKGSSVAEACAKSGFPDYSNFIAVFRKNYGITPLQYRKQYYHE